MKVDTYQYSVPKGADLFVVGFSNGIKFGFAFICAYNPSHAIELVTINQGFDENYQFQTLSIGDQIRQMKDR